MADFALQESSKLISRKIWVIQKSWYFHTGVCNFLTIWRKKWQFLWKFHLSGTAATTLAGIYGALKVQGLPPSAIKDLVFVVCGAGSAASGVMLTIQNAMVRRYSIPNLNIYNDQI